MDELAPNVNVPTIFYYSATNQDSTDNVTLKYKHLKSSLSKILTSFHPFAGRFCRDSHLVDCSDQGAVYVEAEVDICLDDLVRQRMNVKAELLNELLPYPCVVHTELLMCQPQYHLSMHGLLLLLLQELGHVDENYLPDSYNFDSALLLPGLKLMSGLASERGVRKILKFTSWCKFPFYEADFGWGNPVWVSVANVPLRNTVVLIDDKSGGEIEAWVNLDENDMQNFVQHSDIADIMSES
ncbi:hypothetical protein POM88_034183 [Heracleum sosnowskyi]|uniref:Uncharacterized protein n=1 Tax=Heracleum sosnowskyi TaxID=360622 RepID=A0AAD8HJ11_9APIA|nr:hypothetical protein POM88_034183 [Heracleum sosnowskyi]